MESATMISVTVANNSES